MPRKESCAEMTPAAKFMSAKFDFGCVDVEYIGDIGYVRLDDDRRVKIFLTTSFISGENDMLQVVLVSKTRGEIERKKFEFSDYLVRDKSIPRVFNRQGAGAMHARRNTNGKEVDGSVAGWVWNETPVSTKPVVDAICRWIDLFR